MFQPPKQHAPVILEETFMLIKPDASERHAEILSLLHEAQFHVQMKKFAVTRDMAEAIVSRFPCVVHAQLRERGEVASPRAPRAVVRDLSLVENSGPQGSRQSTSDDQTHSSPFGSFQSILRHRTGESAHTDIHNQIMRLTRKDVSELGLTRQRSGAGAGGVPGRTSSDPAHSSSASSSALTASNIGHLLQGTCLALVIASPNAVEKARLLAGPEDPVVASSSAPGSLRARFGIDVVHNAVFVAETPQDASYLIERIFGYEPTPHSLTHQQPPLPRGEARPSMDLVAHGADDPLQALLDTVDQEQQAMFPDIEGRRLVSHAASAGHLVNGARSRLSLLVGASGGGDASKDVVAQMTRILQDERRTMQMQAKVLRIRELDLLLREQELQRAHNPVAAHPPPPSGGGLASVGTSRRSSRRASSLFGGKTVPPPPVMIEQDQIDGIISTPGKLLQIFQKLDTKHCGSISREDFMKLYSSSPCLWKVGVPNHEDIVFHSLPTLGISADYFGLAILQLLR